MELAVRDIDQLKDIQWSKVVLDEGASNQQSCC